MKNVLRYSQEPVSRGTVRKAYLKQRVDTVRCDNPECVYHSQPLMWNGKPLLPTLDHIDGNKQNNLPSNLRLLCPNCDSQLPTRGGKNRGRIQNSTVDSYVVVNKDGRNEHKVFPTGMQLSIGMGTVTVEITPHKGM